MGKVGHEVVLEVSVSMFEEIGCRYSESHTDNTGDASVVVDSASLCVGVLLTVETVVSGALLASAFHLPVMVDY